MVLLKKIVAFLIVSLTAFFMFSFKTVPTGKLWDNYTVIYAPLDVDEQIMIDGFREYEIEEYVCLSKQRVPFMFVKNSVEKAMFSLNLFSQDNSYLEKRENFFYDSAKQYKLYYVPTTYKENVNQLIKALNKNQIAAGIDSSFSYPFYIPLIVIIIALALLLFSKKRYLFLSLLFLPVLYSFTNPFYSCGIASIFIMLLFLPITNLWARKGAIKKLLQNYHTYIYFFIPLLLSFANSAVSGIFFLLVVVSNFTILYAIKCGENEVLKNQTYTFLLIRNAKQVSTYGKHFKNITNICFSAVALIVILSSIKATDTFNGKFAKVLLPGEATISSKNLSDLDDYSKWAWNVKTMPYKSLNKENNSTKVVFPNYVLGDDKIQKQDIVFSLDNNFKQSVIDSIEQLDFYSIEQVLKSQGTEKRYGYTASTSYTVTIFSKIMMIFSILVLLIIRISAILFKGGQR